MMFWHLRAYYNERENVTPVAAIKNTWNGSHHIVTLRHHLRINSQRNKRKPGNCNRRIAQLATTVAVNKGSLLTEIVCLRSTWVLKGKGCILKRTGLMESSQAEKNVQYEVQIPSFLD